MSDINLINIACLMLLVENIKRFQTNVDLLLLLSLLRRNVSECF